ncbi:MAG: hypothetical protein NTW96_14295 [Planctomycetia bacterium]|nr:hypothetical protein [Planctomycetia bacterium]
MTSTPAPAEAEGSVEGGDLPDGPAAGPLTIYDGWEVDEELRHIGRVLGKSPANQAADPANSTRRFDPSHAAPSGAHRPEKRPVRRRVKTRFADTLAPLLGWTTLFAGFTALICGGVLLGWSWFGGRTDLWSVGLPIALAGVIGLLVAFILQLDRLGSASRETVAKLDQVDSQLDELRTVTRLLGSAHHSPAGAFYSHLADGAGPGLLLTDLKSQLDLLAMKLGEQREAADE